ncbi:MAG: TIR domain-containing protein [Anaerolineales bacterium]|nr:TIR domain-containing protein [Anaerolineales bacterium]
MSDVFISYSRKDIAFARLLHEALLDSELETWIDWQDIPPSTDWLAEVFEAIEQADSFVFIISPSSVSSEICEKEIAHAAKNNKRLIPIVINDIDDRLVPPYLAPLNWIFFKEEDEAFRSAVEDLITAIQTDQVWVKEHTRLQNRALEWERKEKERGYLLRGGDLGDAERWLSQAAEKDPQPTALQTQYILASRSDATRRQRITMAAVLGGFIVAIVLGILAWTQRNVAVREANERATAQAIAVDEANNRATAEVEAIREADARGTAESEAVAESQARATAQVDAEIQRDEAERQRDEAQRQARISLSRALSMQAIEQMDIQLDLALLLSAEAYSLDDNMQTRGALLSVLQRSTETSRRYLHGHTNWVSSVDFDPLGRFVASSDLSLGVQLWDLATGQPLGDEGHIGDTRCVAFSPDGEKLAAASGGIIVLWDVTGDGLRNKSFIMGPERIRTGIAFSPDGKVLVSAGPGESIAFWDVETESQMGSAKPGHGTNVDSVAYSSDGNYIASSSGNDSVTLWDASTGRVLRKLANPNPTPGDTMTFTTSHNVAFSPDSRMVAAGFSDGTIHFWNTSSGLPIGDPLHGHTERVFSVAFSPDGKTLVSGGYDNLFIVWDLESKEMLYSPFSEHKSAILGVNFSPTGGYAASASMDTDVILWEMERGRLPQLHSGEHLSIAFSPDNRTLASSAEDGSIRFWDAVSGQALGNPITDLEADQQNLVFSPDGRILASIGRGIHLWDVEKRMQVGETLSVNGSVAVTLAFSPDGSMLASGDGNGFLALWDVATGRTIKSIQAHEGYVFSLAFSPDGNALYSTALDLPERLIHIWDLETNETTQLELSSTVRPGYNMVLHPDTSMLAASSGGPYWNYLLLYDTSTGELLFEPLSGHSDQVTAIAFNPASSTFATGSSDQTIRLWDIVSGQPIGLPIPGHGSSIRGLAFSSDGQILASIDAEGPIRIWDMDPESWRARACLIANRNMTDAEWAAHLGEEPYRETCPDIP